MGRPAVLYRCERHLGKNHEERKDTIKHTIDTIKYTTGVGDDWPSVECYPPETLDSIVQCMSQGNKGFFFQMDAETQLEAKTLIGLAQFS